MWKSIQRSFSKTMLRRSRPVDVADLLIVGAGPSGLSAAIKAKQLNKNLRVVVVEKASEVGLHTLSGAVIETKALDELLPDWKNSAPIYTPALEDKMLFLTKNDSFVLPLPPDMHNDGNYIVSLSQVVKWLGEQAENLGVEIYSGISASQLVRKDDKILGIATSEVGLDKSGEKTSNYDPGMLLLAPITLLGEGCHGSLSKQLIADFRLRQNEPQTYGIGVKEVWEVPEENHQNGLIVHSVGWPLDQFTYGGSFQYHFTDAAKDGRKLISIGYVIGLDYWNVNTRPYMEFQRYKTHPTISQFLKGGKCISYGARALNEGGWQSLPKLNVDGAALIGCSAGFLNLPKIKGTHLAMKSGMLAAEEAVKGLSNLDSLPEIEDESQLIDFPVLNLSGYDDVVKNQSWVGKELYEVRNSRPSFHLGLYAGLLYNGLDLFVLRNLFKGNLPWTFSHGKPDHERLFPANQCPPIDYPKPDGITSFPLLENLARSGTNHNHTQPSHLKLKNKDVQVKHNLPIFGGPEAKFCPAGVYEYLELEKPETLSDGTLVNHKFQINSQNCVHCKT
eukprot:NODE_10_length_61504_cov_0.956502.p6 type:complete len:561 gc:universal NODE_10_length_61504_cov_0.956502:21682-23364(+)